MKNQSNLEEDRNRRVPRGITLLAVSLIPLVTGFVLSRTVSPTSEASPALQVTYDVRNYTAAWGSRSFDEALWHALERIAAIEESLPSHVKRFHVEVRSYDDFHPMVSFNFDRLSLKNLKEGMVAPDVFIREDVDFLN